MQVDRNLGKTADGRVVERDDPECARVLAAKGTLFSDADAKRLGITDFYQRLQRDERKKVVADAKAAEVAKEDAPAEHAAPEAKAVDQAEVEDKSVAGPLEQKTEEPAEGAQTPGVIFPPEVRRGGGGRRG